MKRLLSTNNIFTEIRMTFLQFCGFIFVNKQEEVLRGLILANLAKFSKSSKINQKLIPIKYYIYL